MVLRVPGVGRRRQLIPDAGSGSLRFLPLAAPAARADVHEPTTLRPWRLAAASGVAAMACAILIGGVLLFSRQRSLTSTQQAIDAWGQACVLEAEPMHRFEKLADAAPHPGKAPGAGRYLARTELTTYGALSLADAMISLGIPARSGCMEYGLLPGRRAMRWIRVVFADGQIEAYAVLAPAAQRLSPDTMVHTLRCYAPGDASSLAQTTAWPGMVRLSTIQDCGQTGTAVPH